MPREERIIIPPTRKPVSEVTTPVHTDAFYVERVNRTDPAYVNNSPVKRGTLYSEIVGANPNVIAQFSNLYFLKETRLGQSDQEVLWHWATDRNAQDTYNAEVTYALESVTSPTYARVYTVRRDLYDASTPLALGTPLTALIGVKIVNGGLGYTEATGKVFITGVDSGAAIEFVVSDGVIVSGIVTAEGANITSGAAVTVSGNGQGANVTAVTQPVNAVLISQKKQELPDDQPFRNEFVKQVFIFQTLPGPILTSTTIDAAGDEVIEMRNQVVASTITTVITTAGGVYTKTFEEPINDNNYIAWKVVQNKLTQNPLNSYEVEIPDLLPEEFRPQLPVTTTEQTMIGQVVIPPAPPPPTPPPYALQVGELMRRLAQIDFNTYRLTIRGRGTIPLPQIITNQETTTQFGGGDLDEIATLDLVGHLTLDEGLTVISSEIKKLDDIPPPNGLAVKTTKQLHSGVWPVLASRLWDENMRVEYDETQQVVAAGTSEDSPPSGVFGFTSEVKGIDKWRSRIIDVTKPQPIYRDSGSALITYEFRPYRFPGYLYRAVGGYYVREAHADSTLFTVRTWWLSKPDGSTPTIGPTGSSADVQFDDIIMDNPIINTLNSTTTLSYAGEVLHDDLVTFNTFFYPATTPSATQYVLGNPTGGTTTQNFAILTVPGSTGGYSIGEIVNISGGGFSMSITVTSTYNVVGGPTGLIGGWTNNPGGSFPPSPTVYGPITASPPDAVFDVWSVAAPNYIPGTQWIGQPHVIQATVTPEREINVWKVQTKSVVMR